LPNEWTKGIIIKLPKKGDLTNCNNWRGIALLFSLSKILSRIILNRIKRHIDNKLRREQMGFREGRSCIDQVNTLRIILEQFNEYQSLLYFIFIDFEKSFDSINRNKMWNAMKMFGIPDKIIRLIQEMYKNCTCQVEHNGKLSAPIMAKTGVKQGCLHSPILFLMVLDIMIINRINKAKGAFAQLRSICASHQIHKRTNKN
jgi:hypothetical protein